jgi:hypothetical protein
MNRHTVAALIVLVIALITARSARAQVLPSPPWGEPIQDASIRFVVLASYNNQAVYDNETGLVWEQSPSTTVAQNWWNAQSACNTNAVGNRKGWRLPTVQELASLIDPNAVNPALPAGHPFTGVQSNSYWSASTASAAPTASAWSVVFDSGNALVDKPRPSLVWCVRGGQGVDPQ